ncbi:DUF4595 domain-containing protein [Pedobacter gandavensis]|uniref:DUF4595 domain-containing protein n=1 Tax=Pedobacter gandavensis TaxID=2679963 RepID=UPI00292E6CBA|nr:DUF4595 domain-containing protein [Pedobacter gandavensis]
MLSAISLLIVASCKKDLAKEETNVTCQMTSFTVKSNNIGYEFSSSYSLSYDDKGRITKMKESGGYEMNYSYSSTQIIEESPLKDSYAYKTIYQLDASGKIVSAIMKYTNVGTDEVSSLKYFYNSDGYLSEIQDTYMGETGTNEGETDIDKYNYTNGNLTSIVRTDPNPNGGVSIRTTQFSYNNDLAPSSFFGTYDRELPNAGVLKAYFGKASKNLISEISDTKNSITAPSVRYTYQKNEESNIIHMTETGKLVSNVYGFAYNCK